MRRMSLLLVMTALAACSTAPQPQLRSAENEARFQKLMAGKVAGPAINCLPTFRANDMITIDDNTILFRDGSSRLYINHPRGGCNGLDSGLYALVTRNFGGAGLCSGDLAQVADARTGMIVGSCALGDFVPYTRP